MTAEPLVDQAARDAIVQELDRTLFVEAGAGTGKTRSLVDRVVRLIATGRGSATSIAAITFTEAAAAELRDRLRSSIDELAHSENAPEDERERCEAALNDLDGAAVETIHAFCRRLLATTPLAAGLPPAFDLVTDTTAAAAFRERWERWFEGYLDRAADNEALGRPLLRALALGANPDALFTVAQALHRDWDRLTASDEAVPQPEVEIDALLAASAGLHADAVTCTDADDGMATHLRRLPSLVAAVERAGDDGDDIALIRALRPLAYNARGEPWRLGRTGRAGNWTGRALAEVREECMALHAMAEGALASFAAAAAAEIAREITTFVLAAAEARRREGLLEFQDLLVLTRRMLATQPDIRRAMRGRFTHLFIDEFQDTDPLQAEIAFLLGTSEEGVVEGDWSRLPLDEGRLFFVGDPKQSIYRFRRADIDVYRRIRDTFEGSLLQLTQNFRSVPAVLEWVNAQFVERFAPLDPTDGAPNH